MLVGQQVVLVQELHLVLQVAHLHQVQVVRAQPQQLMLVGQQVVLVQELHLVLLRLQLLTLEVLQVQAQEPHLVLKVMALKA